VFCALFSPSPRFTIIRRPGIRILISEWVKSDFHETPEEFGVIMDKVISPIALRPFIALPPSKLFGYLGNPSLIDFSKA